MIIWAIVDGVNFYTLIQLHSLFICVPCSVLIARFDVSLALQQEQCKSSCHSALAQSRNSSNGNLASSALDAMLSIRDCEEGEDEIHEDRRRVTQNSEKGTASSHSNHYGSRTRERKNGIINESYRNLGYNRPKQRLPPLIETLVGNIDGDGSEDGHQRGSPGVRKRARVIPEKETKDTKNNRGGTEYVGQQPRQNDKYQYYTGDDIDSVAMVAAAAATAALSESASSRTLRWGSMRMKAYNDEWEEALRWISTWGPQDQPEQEQHRHSDEGGRKSLSKAGQHRVKQKVYGDGSTSKNFTELHEICVKRCETDEWEWDPNSEPPIPLSEKRDLRKSYKGSSNNTVTKFLEVIGINDILSPRMFTRISIFLRQTFTFHSTREAFRNIFGVMLSGAIICFSRYIYQWWALNRYTASLQSLLKEEAEKNSVKGKQGKKSNHSGRKKTKQRKKHRVVRGRGKDTHMMSSANAKDETKWIPSSDDDDDSDSDDSLDPFYLLRGKRHYSNTIDSSSDQASKATMETASCTTIDSVKFQASGSQNLSQLDTRVNRKCLQPKKLDMKSSDAFEKSGYINNENCPVPTDAQREQSYQALKAFQRAQLLKLIEDLKKEKVVRKDKGRAKLLVNGIPTTSSNSKENFSLESKGTRLPPPGLSTNTTSGCTKMKKSFTDALLGKQPKEKSAVDMMLSRLLDDGEDDTEIDAVSSTSENTKPVHNEFNRTHEQNQVSPVALGDLLLGTFGVEASNKTFVTQPKSNPWQKTPESFGISGLKDDIRSGQEDIAHSESTDANIQLQVSASEFMPKWGEGTYASENNRIW